MYTAKPQDSDVTYLKKYLPANVITSAVSGSIPQTGSHES